MTRQSTDAMTGVVRPPSPLVVQHGRVSALPLEATVPLGPGAQPAAVRRRLRRGDRLLMFTDGQPGARHPSGSFGDVPTASLRRSAAPSTWRWTRS